MTNGCGCLARKNHWRLEKVEEVIVYNCFASRFRNHPGFQFREYSAVVLEFVRSWLVLQHFMIRLTTEKVWSMSVIQGLTLPITSTHDHSWQSTCLPFKVPGSL